MQCNVTIRTCHFIFSITLVFSRSLKLILVLLKTRMNVLPQYIIYSVNGLRLLKFSNMLEKTNEQVSKFIIDSIAAVQMN